MMRDETLRRALILGVVLTVGSLLLSQVMMQVAGGPRDQTIDLSDQMPGDETLEFEGGLPPFISSGGAFQPEKTVFDIGLALSGLLMIALSFEIFQRTDPTPRKRKIANRIALASGVIVGFSMLNLTAHPLTTSLMPHIFWAMNIFWGAQIWIGCLTYARADIDAELTWRGHDINRIRWSLFAVAILSFQLMTALLATQQLVESALFEWTLTFSAEAMILTLIPTITADP